MRNSIKKILSGPILFAVVNIFSAAAGFLIIPILSNSLSSKSFAAWALCESAWLLSGQLLQMGMGNGAIMLISGGGYNWKAIYRAHIKILSCIIFFGAIFSAFVAWFIGWGGISFGLSMNIFAEGLIVYQTYISRAANLSFVYSLITAGRALSICLIIFIVSLSGANIDKLLFEDMIFFRGVFGVFVSLLCHFYFASDAHKVENGRKISIDAIKFGIPMAVSGVLIFAQDGLVRSTLASLISAEAVEKYYVHIKCVSIAGTFVVAPVGLWWGPQRFRLASQGKNVLERGAQSALRKSLLIYAALIGAMAVFLPEILKIFGPRVHPDIAMIALLAMPPAAQLVATLTNAGLMQSGHTHSLAWVQLGGLVILSVLIIPAVKSAGILGVCATAAISAVIVAFLTARASLKLLPLNYKIIQSVFLASILMVITLGGVGVFV